MGVYLFIHLNNCTILHIDPSATLACRGLFDHSDDYKLYIIDPAIIIIIIVSYWLPHIYHKLLIDLKLYSKLFSRALANA